MCAYFLDLGIEEEEVFWVMVYIIDHVIPKNYYTNMIPLLSDIKLVKYFLKQTKPKMLNFI